ncbi:MAG: hypothetical protein HOD72_00410 [Opitutae bacterium]|nr:hypothetical protein [Opitutae bacterium]MBT4222903.1 hypothetical protein [Opitutae bacterium]MBT5378665.1 hypothetical protein [Opitutae bacterium]MBT6461370.1 hypothetical protein [Opitutae bacterium]MBT7854091.1 hypothetical protein [Opitutae bacterium]
MSDNFIPTLHQVQEATRKLPDVSLWPKDAIAIAVPVSGKSQIIKFEKYQKEANIRAIRWSYRGRVLMS